MVQDKLYNAEEVKRHCGYTALTTMMFKTRIYFQTSKPIIRAMFLYKLLDEIESGLYMTNARKLSMRSHSPTEGLLPLHVSKLIRRNGNHYRICSAHRDIAVALQGTHTLNVKTAWMICCSRSS
jgi:hypothetical protein